MYKEYLNGINTSKVEIRVNKIFNISRTYIPKNKVNQFCNNDDEGAEKDVLLGNDFEKFCRKFFVLNQQNQVLKS